MRRIKSWFVVAAVMVAYVVTSCAVDVDESADVTQKRIFNAFIRANGYDQSEMIGDSIYVIERSGNPSGEYPQDSTYAFVRYAARYTSGEYAAYNIDTIAMKEGTYHPSNFYSSFVWPVKMGYISDPLSDILKNMKPGEKTVSLVPPWIVNYNTSYAFASTTSIMFYEIELEKVVPSIEEYQEQVLKEFSQKYFGGMDTISKGFYFHKFHEGATEDTLTEGTVLDVWYVGRMLDGSVFDTNIEDSAKKYDLYKPDGTYTPLSVLYYKDDPEKIAEEEGYVLGFCKAFTSGVTWGDKCFVFFDSSLGYGAEGNLNNGAGIPPFYPISFELWIEEND